MERLDRRRFLGSLVKSAVGGTLLGVGHSVVRGQNAPAAPRNVTVGGTAGGSRRLIAPGDMLYRGMWRFPATDTWDYQGHPITFRYVGSQRRWLTVTHPLSNAAANYTLRELAEPAGYGQTVGTAPEFVQVRQWTDWNNLPPAAGETFGQGVTIGGLWWDEPQQLLWYTIYPSYGGGDFPVLGCSALNDDGTATKYGMWYYAGPHAKTVCQWIVPIPPSAQGDVGGKTMALGGASMNVDGPANRGPGLYAVAFPARNYSGSIAGGTPFAGYSSQLPGAPALPGCFCRRENDYRVITQSTMYFDGGYWLDELDPVSGYFWIETSTVQGVICMGARGLGYVWYGEPDWPTTNGYPGVTDPIGGSKGSHASAHEAAMWIFNPDDMRAAARGEKQPWQVAPVARYNWHTLWPSVPDTYSNLTSPGGIFSPGGSPHLGAYDPRTRQIAWLMARTYCTQFGRFSTVHVWEVPA